MQQAQSLNLSAKTNEKVWVRAFIDGNEQAFEKLFKLHYQMLLKVALFLLQDAEQSEEIVHDVFLNVWQKRENVNPEASFKNYLITAVRNRCFNHLKAKKKTHSINDDETWVEELVADNHTDTQAQVKDVQKALEEAVNKLPDQCRLIFQLSRYENMSYKEIAAALELSPKTIENQIGRALKALRNDLKDFLPLFLISIILEIK